MPNFMPCPLDPRNDAYGVVQGVAPTARSVADFDVRVLDDLGVLRDLGILECGKVRGIGADRNETLFDQAIAHLGRLHRLSDFTIEHIDGIAGPSGWPP